MAVKKSACMLCPSDDSDIRALQALYEGVANEGQQKHALKWIMECAAGVKILPWSPDSERESAFMAGRVFVGHQIVKLLESNPEKLNA